MLFCSRSELYYSFQEEDILDQNMGVDVVVCGPSGTESVRFDGKSAFYSRISSCASLSSGHTPNHAQVLSIPSKDTPRIRAEVYANLQRYAR